MSPQEPADSDLIDRAIVGNAESWRVLVQRHRRYVLATARSAVKDANDTDDVAQDAFLCLFRSLARLREKESVTAYLHSVTKHCAVHVARASARRKQEEGEANAMRHGSALPLTDCDNLRAEHAALLVAIEKLPARQRGIFRMRYLEERSVREIAAATHIAEGTVRATVHHAVSALRRKLRVPR